MSSNLFPADLRVLGPLATVTGAQDSLEAVNTSQLPNGCLAVVTQGGQIFALDRTSTATAVAGVVVAPAQGGPGRWLLLAPGSGSGEQLSRAVQLTAVLTDFAVISDTWTAIAGAVFASQVSASALFSLTTASGLLTYNGPTRYFELCVEASIGNGEDTTAINVAIAPDVNGALIGTSDSPAYEQNAFTNAAQDVPNYLHAMRYALIATGDTIQPVVKNITAGDLDLNIQKLVMTVRPVL